MSSEQAELMLEALERIEFLAHVGVVCAAACWAGIFVRLFLYAMQSRNF